MAGHHAQYHPEPAAFGAVSKSDPPPSPRLGRGLYGDRFRKIRQVGIPGNKESQTKE